LYRAEDHRSGCPGQLDFLGKGGLDNEPCLDKINSIKALFMPSACDHTRTQIIARRDGVDYVECLDCRQIFEAEDLEPVKVDDEEE
jgi:hypothetical protein